MAIWRIAAPADEWADGGDDLLLARPADMVAGRRVAGARPAPMASTVMAPAPWPVPGLRVLGVALMLAALLLAW